MNTKIITLFAFGFLMCVGLSSADAFGETGWNNTDETIWNDTSTWNVLTETIAEFDVVANMSATQLWAQVNLSTNKIDFGSVESGNISNRIYTIRARGNVDIVVKPELLNNDDKIFSNLKFSRLPSGTPKKIGLYNMTFNLTQNRGTWSVLGGTNDNELKNISGQNTGSQVLWLDLTSFNGVIPFDEPYQNIVKFRIIPVRADNPYL